MLGKLNFSNKKCLMFLALLVRFDNHYKILILSEKVLGVVVDDLLMIFDKNKCYVCISFFVVKRSPFKHNHNELYSEISKIEISRKCFQVLDVKRIVRNICLDIV